MCMRQDFYYASKGAGQIRAARWVPDGEIKGIVQLVHGIAEHVERYDAFAQYLNTMGILVVAEDHMGHGKSINGDGIQGYFHGGWFTAVEDTVTLMKMTMEENPGVPYVLFGHSMGSFMARTILARYPDCGITGCVICGTAWQSGALLAVALPLAKAVCKSAGERKPSKMLYNLMFGSYNDRVEHLVTASDWLSRDKGVVNAYIDDPLCGFVATAGLYRDMLQGISYIQKESSLQAMNKTLPVLFAAGGDDPVGSYGSGVKKAAEEFRKAGMEQVKVKLFPLCRHEILNEINRSEVFAYLGGWIGRIMEE